MPNLDFSIITSTTLLLRSGPLRDAVQPYVWFRLSSASVERSFSMAGLLDTKNRTKMSPAFRQNAVMLFCNGDAEERFMKRPSQ